MFVDGWTSTKQMKLKNEEDQIVGRPMGIMLWKRKRNSSRKNEPTIAAVPVLTLFKMFHDFNDLKKLKTISVTMVFKNICFWF